MGFACLNLLDGWLARLLGVEKGGLEGVEFLSLDEECERPLLGKLTCIVPRAAGFEGSAQCTLSRGFPGQAKKPASMYNDTFNTDFAVQIDAFGQVHPALYTQEPIMARGTTPSQSSTTDAGSQPSQARGTTPSQSSTTDAGSQPSQVGTGDTASALALEMVAAVKSEVATVRSLFGCLTESIIQEKVASHVGLQYSQSYCANSIPDLIKLLPVTPAAAMDTDQSERMAIRRVVDDLLQKNVPWGLFLHLRATLPLKFQDLNTCNWVDGDGHIDAAMIRTSYSKLSTPARETLDRLVRHIQLQPAEKPKDLKLCSGVGLMCVVYESCSEFQASELLRLPLTTLEIDVRGRAEVNRRHNVATIEVGEIKQGKEYGGAIHQLGIRLKVLKYLLQISTGITTEKIYTIGRLMLWKTNKPSAAVQEELVALAFREHGFSLYFHLY